MPAIACVALNVPAVEQRIIQVPFAPATTLRTKTVSAAFRLIRLPRPRVSLKSSEGTIVQSPEVPASYRMAEIVQLPQACQTSSTGYADPPFTVISIPGE